MDPTSEAKIPATAVVEYENVNVEPSVYVEGALLQVTPKGSLQISFFSEYLKYQETVVAPLKPVSPVSPKGNERLDMGELDMFGVKRTGQVHVLRRVEASLVFTLPTLKTLIPDIQQRMAAMEEQQRGKNE